MIDKQRQSKDGKKVGEWKTFLENGQVEIAEHYVDGKKRFIATIGAERRYTRKRVISI